MLADSETFPYSPYSPYYAKVGVVPLFYFAPAPDIFILGIVYKLVLIPPLITELLRFIFL